MKFKQTKRVRRTSDDGGKEADGIEEQLEACRKVKELEETDRWRLRFTM
jgi:hypothetical protein